MTRATQTPRLYLDSASCEPLLPVAREALLEALDDGWADPARLYREGRRARRLLDDARCVVAAAMGCRPDGLTFTSGHVSALHTAVLGVAGARQRRSRHVVASAVEHSAVLHACAWHTRAGGTHELIGVDADGCVDVDALMSAASRRHPAAAVCLQAANHEVGTSQPVASCADQLTHHGVPLVMDAGQIVGRAPLPAGWSAAVATASSWGGPAGVGVVALQPGVRFRSFLPEDDRESGRAPGRPDVARIHAAATALQASMASMADVARRQRTLIDHLRSEVPRLVPDVAVLGHSTERLPHVVTFSCLYVDGESLVNALDAAGFAVSSGSSCTSSTLQPSHVLVAMGALTHGNVRISLTQSTTRAQVDAFLGVLPGIVARLRAATGVADL